MRENRKWIRTVLQSAHLYKSLELSTVGYNTVLLPNATVVAEVFIASLIGLRTSLHVFQHAYWLGGKSSDAMVPLNMLSQHFAAWNSLKAVATRYFEWLVTFHNSIWRKKLNGCPKRIMKAFSLTRNLTALSIKGAINTVIVWSHSHRLNGSYSCIMLFFSAKAHTHARACT